MIDEKVLRSKEFSQYYEKMNQYDHRLMSFLYVEEELEKNVRDLFDVYKKKWAQEESDGNIEVYQTLLSSGQLSFNKDQYDEKLVEAIGYVHHFQTLDTDVRNLYREYHKDVQNDINEAKPILKNRILWMLTKNDEKQRALKAASRLYSINPTFFDTVERIEKQYKQIQTSDFLKEFFDHEEEYCLTLNGLVGNTVYFEKDPVRPNFDAMNQGIHSIEDCASKMDALIKEEKKLVSQIIGTMDLISKEACQDTLKEISVDELKKNKVRVSVLKQGGYENIQDVLNASVIELSQINGISEEGAYRIKETAEQILQECKANIKLRLNRDDANAYTDALVKCICEYLDRKNCFEKAIEYSKENPLKEMVVVLKGVSKCTWLTSSHEDKVWMHQMYQTLKQSLQNDGLQKAKEIIEQTKDFKNYDVQSSWDCFEKRNADFYAILEQFRPGSFGNDDTYYGLPEELAQKIEEESIFPNGLNVTLRRYQEWGVKYILHQKKVLLGDEMGLGKTIQALACMVSLKNTGATHFMVVCPLSVLINWCREIETRSKLKVVKIHGNAKENALKEWLKHGGVAVTTYETTGVLQLPDDFMYSMLVVDEAHYIKNPEAKRSKNVIAMSKKAERLLFMTGTALENNVDEMVKLIRDLQPDVANQIEHIKHLSSADGFKEKVAGVYYRRKREDVLTELPDLVEKQQWCELLEHEKELYEKSVQEKKFSDSRRVSWNVEDYNESSKALRLKEIIQQAKEENRKVIVFSFFLETIQKIKAYLGDICSTPITGSIKPEIRQEIIDAFSNAPAGHVLLAQIVAGGTGLNIQSASVIVICEPQFKPSIENQAISRAYRMGQSRSVLVHRLLCANTIDEKITKVLENKQGIFDAFADESVAAKESLELDQKTFTNMIEEEIERIKNEAKQ